MMILPRVSGQHTLRAPQVQGHTVALTLGECLGLLLVRQADGGEAVARMAGVVDMRDVGSASHAAKYYPAQPR